MKKTIGERVLGFLKTKPSPEGLCPNCWGRQEYSGEFYDAMKNDNININEVSNKVGWIAEYAAKNLNAIELIDKKGSLECPVCKVTYSKGELHKEK